MTKASSKVFLKSPLGAMVLCFEQEKMISADWPVLTKKDLAPRVAVESTEGIVSVGVTSSAGELVVRWFADYFDRREKSIDIDVSALKGSPFQKKVWKTLLTIPRGETRSYSDIARAIKSPRAMRAVGMACGRNPIPLLIPCHRVVGASGKLTGFSGGLWRKEWLLQFEKQTMATQSGARRSNKRAA